MIIGIASLTPQVGKTTAANYLIEKHDFAITEMGDAVTYVSTKYFGFSGNKLDPSQRLILQKIGKAGKEIDKTIWLYYALWLIGVSKNKLGLGNPKTHTEDNIYEHMTFKTMDRFRNKIKKEGFSKLYHSNYPQNIIVSGVRSPSEANGILELGGKVWLITNNRVENKEVHAVENELFGYDRFSEVIENNDSFENFYSKIDEIMINNL